MLNTSIQSVCLILPAALRNENNHIVVLNGPIFEKKTKISVHDEKRICLMSLTPLLHFYNFAL